MNTTETTQIALLLIGLLVCLALGALKQRIERKGRKARHHMFIQEEGKLK